MRSRSTRNSPLIVLGAWTASHIPTICSMGYKGAEVDASR